MTQFSNSNSSHTLIDGLFSGPDAQEVLLTLLNSKIDHHTRRCFSSLERFGETDHESARRTRSSRPRVPR